MKKLLIILYFFLSVSAESYAKAGKRKVYTTTPTYSEIVSTYESLAAQSPYVKLISCGLTDVGKPLQLMIISKNKEFNPD